jgi:hypothetical protein
VAEFATPDVASSSDLVDSVSRKLVVEEKVFLLDSPGND